MASDLASISASWSRAFNSLPDDVRRIGVASEIKTRLQHLHFERQRLKQAYDLSLSKIREHEKNLEASLRRLGYAPATGETDQPSTQEPSP